MYSILVFTYVNGKTSILAWDVLYQLRSLKEKCLIAFLYNPSHKKEPFVLLAAKVDEFTFFLD